MRCPLPLTKWWQDYVAGRLKTPRDIVSAAWNENPDQAQAADRFFGVPDPGPVWDVPARLSAPGFMRSEAHMRQGYRADWAFCDPRLMVFAATLINMAARRDIPLYVHTALRSRKAQEDAVRRGVSKASYGRSAHNIGCAVDVVHGVFHWYMNRSEWALLHALGLLALEHVNTQLPRRRKLALTWGGNFRSLYDPAHWEVSDFRDRLHKLPPAAVPIHMSPDQILKRRADLLSGG